MTARVDAERLTRWARACLLASGVPEADAQLVAGSLVQTSLWGIDSHGVLRLTHYLRRMSLGSVAPMAVPVVKRTGPVTAQLDGRDVAWASSTPCARWNSPSRWRWKTARASWA